MNVLLTPHFSIQELIFSEAASRLGLPNSPDVDQLGNLKRLCVVLLEPARELIGEPLRVTSGFRTVEVNGHLPGASRTSAHMDGRAADVMPLESSVFKAFELLKDSTLEWDQLILEHRAWLHLAVAREGEHPRREVLLARGTLAGPVYERIA